MITFFIKITSMLLLMIMPTAWAQCPCKDQVILEANLLSKQWYLEKYEVLGQWYLPETNEQGDYVSFRDDDTYTSVSEGKYSEGIWTFEPSTCSIIMKDEAHNGTLHFVITKLSKQKLIVRIEDKEDPDAKYVSIHFKTEVL